MPLAFKSGSPNNCNISIINAEFTAGVEQIKNEEKGPAEVQKMTVYFVALASGSMIFKKVKYYMLVLS